MVIGLLLGAKYCCFICEWEVPAKQARYIQKDWPLLEELIPANKSVSYHL